MSHTQMKSIRKAFSFSLAFCLLLFLTLSIPFHASAAEWEETYFGSPLEYYAGGEKTISTSDSSYADWSEISKVTVNSVEHPENWYGVAFEEITFSYALAWDRTNLYIYQEIDKPFTSFSGDTCISRFYFNTFSTLKNHTYIVQFNYDEEKGIYISRASRAISDNDPEFVSAIGIHSEETDGKTIIEMSVPWSIITEGFTPEAGASIRYCISIMTNKSGGTLYAQDTSMFGTTDFPWINAKKYLIMHFSEGTPALPVISPKELEESEILKNSYKEVNAALGKNYTGTVPTGWVKKSTKLLTEGSFQDINTITGDYMEGFQPSDFSGGAITKTIDLSSMVSGLYKFEIGSAQIVSDKILFPSQVLVYASANGYHYQLLGTATATGHTSSSDGLKEIQRYKLTLEKGVTARYIRIKVFEPESSYSIVPLSEITAVYNADASLFPEESAVVSLGAKVNTLQNGLRFGAKYNRIDSKEVKQLGMLLYPTAKLGASTLNMDYYRANPYSSSNPSGVILMNAVYISASDYHPGKEFKDYESFVYFVTLLNIPDASLSVNITAVPFIEYTDGEIIYGEPLVRNYNAVKAAADSILE